MGSRLAYVVRFFRVVSPNTALMSLTFVAATLVCSIVVVVDGRRAPEALTPLLLLQLFAAASGFMVPARRGHYDLVLTLGLRRWHIALVHWVLSVAPGLTSWVVLAGVESMSGAGGRLRTTGTMAAMLLVSVVPWALTIRLPRFAGGIGWLVMLAVAAAVVPEPWPWHGDAAALWPDTIGAATALVLYPPTLVGKAVGGGAFTVGVMSFAVLVLAGALLWIERQDIPLETAQ